MNPDVLRQMTEARSDYRASKASRFRSRLTGVAATGSGADYHYRTEFEWLRMLEQAREFDRNDIIVGSAIDKLVSNVLQEGFNVDPQTGDEVLNEELKARFSEWESDPAACHSEGEHDFRELTRFALRSTLVDGDFFMLGLRGGPLQAIEAHRVRTPRNTRRDVVHGVMLDRRARRKQVWVTKEDLDPFRSLNRVSDIKPYDVRDADGFRQVFQTYLPKRSSQRRGVTAFAPIMDTVGIHDDVQFAMLVKQQMGSIIAILREMPENWTGDDSAPLGDTDEESEYSVRPLSGVNAGLEVTSSPGEKIKAFAPDIPGPSYFEHASLLLTLISVNLDLPMQVMLLDPSKTNFSGWRGAIDQARMRMRWIQQALIARLHRPVYEWKVRQWIASDPTIGRMVGQSGINPLRHRWNAPGWAYIEPLKDASADVYQLANSINSPRRIQAARGRDWDDVYRELIDDVASAIAYAHEKAEALGIEGVNWSTLYRPPSVGDNLPFIAQQMQSEGQENTTEEATA
jgi:capsid protein